MRIAFATLSFALLIGLPALADDLHGNELLPKCEAEVKTGEKTMREYQGSAYCQGLVRGVNGASLDIDPPEHVTLDQAARIVLLYLQAHPEELQKPDFILVHEALHKAFPAKSN